MNRKYTTILIAVVASFLTCGLAMAQDPQTDDPGRGGHDGGKGRHMEGRGQRRPMDPEQMIRMLNRRLDLDDTQTTQIENIMAGVKPEFDALREKGKANREAKQNLDVDDPDYGVKMQNIAATTGELAATATELRGRIRAEVNAILTPEQQEKLETAAKKGRQKGQRNRRHGGPEPAPQ
jgi:Spy/CpxP family protein refolding chaperone